MAIQTFYTGDDYAPSLGLSGDHGFRALEAKFGKGYRQVTQDGLNSEEQKWSVTWKNVDIDTVGADIKSFLSLRGKHEVFYWTPPNNPKIKVRMMGFSETYDWSQNVMTIATVFEESFEVAV